VITRALYLSEAAALITSGSRGWRSRLGSGSGRFVLAQCVRDGVVDLSSAPTVDAPDDKEALRSRIRLGDLLITIVGDVGRVALVREDPGEAYVSQSVALIRPNGRVDPRYLETYLRSPTHGQSYFRGKVYGVGRGHLLLSHLRDMSIPFPADAEQESAVVEVDRRLGDLESAEGRLQPLLMKLRGLRRALVRDVVDRAAEHGEPRALGELSEIQGGLQIQPKRRPRANSYPFLRVANVLRGRLRLDVVDRMELFGSELERLRLRTGDLLIVEGNGSQTQIGRMAVWDGSIVDCVHQNHIIRARPGPDLLPEWAEIVWNSPQGSAAIREVASSTSGLYTLSVQKVARLRVPVPPVRIQRELASELNHGLSLAEHLESEVQAAARRTVRLRGSILGAAIDGVLGDHHQVPA
jgi:type I restriction enzyme S subunit